MSVQIMGRRARRGRRSLAGRARPLVEINVTPFVDVMMVLLVVFMVAAPLLTVGVPLQLPRTAAEPLPVEREEPLTINLDSDGRLYVQKTEVAAGELLPQLQAIMQERQSNRVYLRADASLSYGRVAEVMGMLNQGGFRDIGLVTDPAGPQDQPQ